MAGDDPVLRAALTPELLSRAAHVCLDYGTDAMRETLLPSLVAALTARPEAAPMPTYGDGACGCCGHLSSRHNCDHEASDMSCFDCPCEAFTMVRKPASPRPSEAGAALTEPDDPTAPLAPDFVQAQKDWQPLVQGQAIAIGNALNLDAAGVLRVQDALNRGRIAGYCRGVAARPALPATGTAPALTEDQILTVFEAVNANVRLMPNSAGSYVCEHCRAEFPFEHPRTDCLISQARDIVAGLNVAATGTAPRGFVDGVLYCYGGCGRRYADFGLDVILPTDLWNQVAVGAPFDETQENIEREGRGGVLCAQCVVERLAKLPGVTAAYIETEDRWAATGTAPASLIERQPNIYIAGWAEGWHAARHSCEPNPHIADAMAAWEASESKTLVDELVAVTGTGAWQPIETAPEATYVLVWLPNYGAFRATRTGRDWWCATMHGGEIVYPSHWQPDIAGPLAPTTERG